MVSKDSIHRDINIYWNKPPKKNNLFPKIGLLNKNIDFNHDALVILTEWKEFQNYDWDKILKKENYLMVEILYQVKPVILLNYKNV